MQMINDFKIDAVCHGMTPILPDVDGSDPYEIPKEIGTFHRIDSSNDLTSDMIVQRIIRNKFLFEERNKKKGSKGELAQLRYQVGNHTVTKPCYYQTIHTTRYSRSDDHRRPLALTPTEWIINNSGRSLLNTAINAAKPTAARIYGGQVFAVGWQRMPLVRRLTASLRLRRL
ncbi:hypothetical protein LSH36_118g07059 [Paralvinella palmiformis]|uniref:Uncharacterized protein n=1 Tax=Paralvinella palmiformis TaxID=53620 RepID=A0AAD9JXV8_9ANNE|nr:hypothetical protein LSH36_118g07059 [Paralvinella palmiformis]